MELVHQPRERGLALPRHPYHYSNEQLISRFDTHLRLLNLSPLTIRDYIGVVRKFARATQKPFVAVTRSDVTAYLGWLMEQKGRNRRRLTIEKATIAREHDILGGVFYDFLLRDKYILKSPFLGVPRCKVPKYLPEPAFSDETIARLIAACEHTRELAIIELYYGSGIRSQELVNLRVEDLNLADGTFRVNRGKGDKDRIAYFGTKAAEALKVYLAGRKRGPVFIPERKQRGSLKFVDGYKRAYWIAYWRSRDADGRWKMHCDRIGSYEELPTKERAQAALDAFLADKLPEPVIPEQPLTKSYIARILKRVAKRAGETGVHPHRFRTTFATHLLRERINHKPSRRMNERELMSFLGHSNLAATQKYLALDPSLLRAIHAKCHPHG